MNDGLFYGRGARFAYAKVALPLFRRIATVNPLIVYYHIVSDKKVPHVENLYSFRSVAEFEKDMDVLLKFFQPVSLQDFLSSLGGKQPLPRNSLLLTFDDGLRECHEIVAPILKKKGIPATFFLCSGFVDNRELAYDFKKSLLADLLKRRSLSPAEVRHMRMQLERVGILETELVSALLSVDYRRRAILDEIANLLACDFSAYLESVQPYLSSNEVLDLLRMGHSIGAHSIDHPRYADLPLADQLYQTRESVSFVRDRFSLGYGAFAFPSSDANVSMDFYEAAFGTGDLDVCFGNHGLLRDCVPRSLQRSTMEKTDMPAEAILGKSYVKRCAKWVTGQLTIRRPRSVREPTEPF